jgi:hypothetical protein
MSEPKFHQGARILGDELQRRFSELNEKSSVQLLYALVVFPIDKGEPASLSTNVVITGTDPGGRLYLANVLEESAEHLRQGIVSR